jgi:hypothetical protein
MPDKFIIEETGSGAAAKGEVVDGEIPPHTARTAPSRRGLCLAMGIVQYAIPAYISLR